MRAAFLFTNWFKELIFVSSISLEIPSTAQKIKTAEASYDLPFDLSVQLYEIPGAEAYLYVQKNPVIESLKPELIALLKRVINEQIKESFENVEWEILMDTKPESIETIF